MHKHFFYILFTIISLIINCGICPAQKAPTDSTVKVSAGKHYKAGIIKRFFLGAHYRKEWSTEVEVKVFNINTWRGGLKPIKQGGSRQTTNLRLEDSKDQQYVIRSIDKTPTRALPEELRKTLIAYIFQDQTSSENPYGPLTIPPLAKAAGIFYTNPELIYIPYDTSFGEFAPVFQNMLAYIEERPDADMSSHTSAGNSEKVVGTEKMFEYLYENYHNKVDEPLLTRTRLFDMLIGDWGRHEDQWRWATFEDDKGKLIKPIPRDRDHVFFKSDGLLPHIASRKWAYRKNQNFDYKIKDVIGLNTSATSLDRSLLQSLNRQEWINIAESLKASLTDSVIEDAIRQMPPQIFKLHGEEIVSKLKHRRNNLPQVAEKYYQELAKEPDITGTDKNEYFIIKRINDSETEVLKFSGKNKSGGDTLYHRVFSSKETKEIRIYGLGGDDEFHVSGKTRGGPRIRIIGGEGEDIIIDSSEVRGSGSKTIVYDTPTGAQISGGKETDDHRSDRVADSVNLYKRTGHLYNFIAPGPSYEFNIDDGFFIGIGALRRTFAFRKTPYSSLQRIGLTYATSTSALSFRYSGDFKKVIRNWNMQLDLIISGPKYALNYFGMGNESVQKDTSISYYRVKASQLNLSPMFYRDLSKNLTIGFGTQYQYIAIDNTEGRFISQPEAKVAPSVFDISHYIAVKLYSKISTLDNNFNPGKGIRWSTEAGGYQRLGHETHFIKLNSDFAVFYTPVFLKVFTFATRLGGATNFGDFEFFQANTLGGTTNLRGYRRSRYYGRSSFFHNTELRFKLLDVNFYLFPGKIGLLGFYDYGRVWANGEKSELWHSGYGPGLWIQVYNKAAITATYGLTPASRFLNLQVGFLF
jgi:hypothetical protein